MSKCESGERRLDPIELAAFANLYSVTITSLVGNIQPVSASASPLLPILRRIRDTADTLERAMAAQLPTHDAKYAEALATVQQAIRQFSVLHYCDSDGNLLGARDRIKCYLVEHVGEAIDGGTLEVVGAIGEWARRVRELRHEFGGMTISTGMDHGAGLKQDQYRLESLVCKEPWQRTGAKTFSAVLKRDDHRCRTCGWCPIDGESAGRRFLEVNHKIQVKRQGKPTVTNLETLCNKCHDALST